MLHPRQNNTKCLHSIIVIKIHLRHYIAEKKPPGDYCSHLFWRDNYMFSSRLTLYGLEFNARYEKIHFTAMCSCLIQSSRIIFITILTRNDSFQLDTKFIVVHIISYIIRYGPKHGLEVITIYITYGMSSFLLTSTNYYCIGGNFVLRSLQYI